MSSWLGTSLAIDGEWDEAGRASVDKLKELGWVSSNLDLVAIDPKSKVGTAALVEVLDKICFGRTMDVEAMLESESAAARSSLKGDTHVRGLIPTLRGYQAAAVEWMVARETSPAGFAGWQRERGIWYNSLLGRISLEEPFVNQDEDFPGGLLCDQMGLGKTVCVLALVLRSPVASPPIFHQKVHQQDTPRRRTRCVEADMACLCGKFHKATEDVYRCSECGRGVGRACYSSSHSGTKCLVCEINEESVAGGTLVAAPRAIVSQWLSEAARHAPGLRACRYDGVRQLSKAGNFNALSPRYLAQFDIVVASYEALGTDLAHADVEATTTKYAKIRSPLVSVRWKRCVLDEAQRCESGTSACAKLAERIFATSRWAVTGTPVGRKGWDDLKGLFAFCRTLPWGTNEKEARDRFWKRRRPEALAPLVSRVLWRATKRLVNSEDLSLPSLSVRDELLDFTDVERVFYDDHAARVKAAVAQTLRKYKREEEIVDRVATHVVALRQACCHPSAGSSGANLRKRKRKKLATTTTAFHTLSEVLTNLCLDARVACEEQHRLVTLFRCGLAALLLAKSSAIEQGYFVDVKQSSSYRSSSSRVYAAALEDVDAVRRPIDLVSDLEVDDGASRLVRGDFRRIDFVAAQNRSCRLDADSNRRLLAVAVRRVPDKQATFPRRLVVRVLHGSVVEASRVADIDLSPLASSSDKVVVASLCHCDEIGIPLRARAWSIEASDDGCVEARFFEAEIDTDHLQELHVAHNLVEGLRGEDNIVDESYVEYMSPTDGLDVVELRRRATHAEAIELRPLRALHGMASMALAENVRKVDQVASRAGAAFNLAAAQISNQVWRDVVRDTILMPMLAVYPSEVREGWCVYNDFRFVRSQLEASLGSIETLRVSLLDSLGKLSLEPSPSELAENSDCGVCKADFYATGPRCRHCDLERKLRDYEHALFHFDTQDTRRHNDSTRQRSGVGANEPNWRVGADAGAYQGERGDSGRRDAIAVLVERALSLYARRRYNGQEEDDVVERRKLMEREFGAMRRMWRAHFDLLSFFDTVRLSKTTVALAESQEHLESIAPEVRTMYVLPNEHEIAARVLEMKHDLDDALVSRREARSKFHHLLSRLDEDSGTTSAFALDEESWRKARQLGQIVVDDTTIGRVKKEEKEDDWKCAVCLTSEDVERAVMTKCGHSYCSKCVRAVLSAGGGGGAKCPECRRFHPLKEISFTLAVSSNASKPVRTYGAKIFRVASEVEACPEKCLIFCEWEAVLDIIAHALDSLNVSFERPTGSAKKTWDDKIARFKSNADTKALLLNVKIAGNGLTIVEASHVFIVHPLLSTAIEDQAIGRIHRLGQTKPCVVTRYVVKDTIEQRLHDVQQAHKVKTEQDYRENLTAVRKKTVVAATTPPTTKKKRRKKEGDHHPALNSAADLRALFDLAA